MTDRPIIFSAPMIIALRKEAEEPGTGKSMTRRLASSHKIICDPKNGHFIRNEYPPSRWQYAKVGDRLWVKESFVHYREKCKESSTGFVDWIHYRATDEDAFLPGMKWKPSIFMPRMHSRLTLVVTAIKIERLQNITEHDCEREGCIWDHRLQVWNVLGALLPSGAPIASPSARNAFAALWDTVNGSGAWLANPEVVAITFTVQEQNIDAKEITA